MSSLFSPRRLGALAGAGLTPALAAGASASAAGPEARAATAMCLDVGNARDNGDRTLIWECGSTNTNQKWVLQRGYVKVADTL